MTDINLFGEPVVWDVKRPVEPKAADSRRSLMHTCWTHCVHCSPTLLGQKSKYAKRRVYRPCTHPIHSGDGKCFEDTVICEMSSVFDVAAPQQVRKGWEDF